MNVSAERIRRQISNVLLAWGMPEDLVATTAEIMVETDLMGVDSHGISMLMTYEDLRTKGGLKLDARPRVLRDAPGTALIDGGDGLGHPVTVMATDLAVDKALRNGVGVVGVRNSHHFGAAGVYARRGVARGAVVMLASSTRGVNMVPTRGRMPVLGTNPLAFAAPTKRNAPFVLDMATTTVAANKVKVYDLNEKPIPPGWVVDAAGQPVTDSREGFDVVYNQPAGGLTPLGGTPESGSHKGYGLATMVHILGGVLVGASFSPLRKRTEKPGDPNNIGHFVMALDPALFREPGEFEDDLDAVIDELHATPPADPAKPVLVAGEPEDATRARRLAEGVPVPPSLQKKLRDICARCGAEYVLAEG
ncbi:Ldh family oxidoreductase [Roseomonas sp. NAR14]|uniref:Ldh family oxidoreductase n=1 Tax=Roseomonas acroporae TaxID=2937791 RepID=A0A9X1YHT2_9PROT|nr:Ldh family oxidoreductase [Roseomonas acroporae]MCK8786391.1 Ldh family oxidoreductase [Roseomonas acroporae]